MSKHPSMTSCEMCGILLADRDLHNAWHVKLADHDAAVLDAVDAAVGSMESISEVQDIDGERIAALEGRF